MAGEIECLDCRIIYSAAVICVTRKTLPPDLSEEDVRWIQQFAAHLITEFSVLKQRELLYAPLEDDSSEDQDGNLFDRVGTL